MPLMPFREVRLPSDLSFGSQFGPAFHTDVVVLGDGSEQRNSKWSQARHQGDARYSVKTVAQLQVLLAFFHARHGRAQAFRYKWHLDYRAINQPFAITDGTSTVFQLMREHRSGGSLYQQQIRKPVGIGYPIGNTYDSVSLFLSGTPVSDPYTLDYTTGQVIFGAPPVGDQLLTWTGEFDWPVRFDVDTLAESLQLVKSLTTPGGPPVTPSYCALQDADAVAWYFWVDMLGQLQRDTVPPTGTWEALTTGAPPRWHEVLDETSTAWWLYPDLAGNMQADTGAPGGSGLVFNTQPLDGITLVGANGITRYRLTSDSNQQVTLVPVITLTQSQIFDGIGMAESLPLIEVR